VVIDIETGELRDVYMNDGDVRIARDVVEDNRDFLLSEWDRILPIP
jgi:hypothetical protein